MGVVAGQIGGMVSRFIDRYSADRRERRLTEREILELKEAQNFNMPTSGNNPNSAGVARILLTTKIPYLKGGKGLRIWEFSWLPPVPGILNKGC